MALSEHGTGPARLQSAQLTPKTCAEGHSQEKGIDIWGRSDRIDATE